MWSSAANVADEPGVGRPPHRRLRRWWVDLLCAASLAIGAFAMAGWYVPHFAAAGGKPWFYQEEFGAAVMAACGFGYVNPDLASQPALDQFLQRSRDAVACQEVAGAQVQPLRPMQRAFRYLMVSVAETWRFRGEVAWSGLTPLFALLFAVTTVLAYAIFRQGMGPVVAWVGGVALMTSTLQLTNLPHLRDYAKAPFVLALVLIALRLVVPPATARRTLRLAIVAGLLTGIGIGFRNDLLVAVPAFVVVLTAFLPGNWRQSLRLRAVAVATYLLAVVVAMSPMLGIYSTGGGSSSQHLVLLGLTRAFSRDLGVVNSGLYQGGFEYRDELALAIIDNYSDRRLGAHRFLPMYSADYDRAASRYLQDIARIFPADLLARFYASAVRITELPYLRTTSALLPPPFVHEPLNRRFEWRASIVAGLGSIWTWAYLLTLVVLGMASLRLGLFAAALILYLSGYPSLQFQERHFFHLEFVAWWVLGFAVSWAIAVAAAAIRRDRQGAWFESIRPEGGWPRSVVRSLALCAGLVVALAGPLSLLRAYQGPQVQSLLRAIATAPRVDVTTVAMAGENGKLLFETPDLTVTLPPDDGVHAVYLAASLGGPGCDVLTVDLTQRYRSVTKPYDFTHTVGVPVPVSDTPVEVFFPVYFRNPHSTDPLDEGFGFAGLELPAAAGPCLIRVSRLPDPSPFAVLLDVQLPPDWEQATPYATITGVEGRVNPAAAYAFPEHLSRRVAVQALRAQPVPFAADDIAKQARTFTMQADGWRVAGAGGVGGRGPLLYLVEMKPRRLARGSFLIAEGHVDRGGVTFGLVRDVEWVVQLHVPQTGPFAAVIEVPEDGDYKVIMANNLREMSLDNRVRVTKVGLLPPSAGAPQ